MWRLLFLSTSAVVVLVQGVSASRGGALYRGVESLRASIRGQEEILPAEAVRCMNCHDVRPRGSVLLAGSALPHLNYAWLSQMRKRRGGPPSRFDETTFCQLLRTGADPVHILIAREMPTYRLNDDQCASLWIFCNRKEAAK